MTDITPVLQAIITLSFALLTVVVIPYIKKKADAEDLAEFQKWVQVGVKMADQLAKSGAINKYERRNKVLEFLNKKGYDVDFDTIDALIESEVIDLPPFSDPDNDGVTADGDDTEDDDEK